MAVEVVAARIIDSIENTKLHNAESVIITDEFTRKDRQRRGKYSYYLKNCIVYTDHLRHTPIFCRQWYTELID